jgi:hypothetical protein
MHRLGAVPTTLVGVLVGVAGVSSCSGSIGSAGGPDASGADASGPGGPDAGRADAGGTDAGDAATPPGADASAPFDAGLAGDGGIVLPSGRSFPDTNATIAILADQLPTMNSAQMQFAASHYVGTQKQLLPVTQALRSLNSNFLVLHYHLAMWQSAPCVTFIVNGVSWGNDYDTVTMNESWFWHNTSNQRVASSADGKLLMNVSVAAFQQYWTQSLEQQVSDGDYDAIFLDSASPALLQGECGGTGANQDSRLAGTAARYTSFAELGNTT